MNLKLNTKHTAILVGAILTSGALAAWAANSGVRLTMNGKTASSDVRTMGGKTYVPLADVAKSLGMKVVKRGNGWEIKKAGGTYQVGDLRGKIGDVLYDGKWRFQVISMQTPEMFQMRTDSQPYSNTSVSIYDTEKRTLRPKDSYKLVVFKIRVTNTAKVPQTLWTSISDTTMRTALTDMEGESHPPLVHDYEGGPTVTKPLLPGSSLTFSTIFGVREETVLKDLVFTLKNNDYSNKGNDARVSLAQ